MNWSRIARVGGGLVFVLVVLAVFLFSGPDRDPPTVAARRDLMDDASLLAANQLPGAVLRGRPEGARVRSVYVGLEYSADAGFDEIVRHYDPQLLGLNYAPAQTAGPVPRPEPQRDYCRGQYRAAIAYFAGSPATFVIALTWDGQACA